MDKSDVPEIKLTRADMMINSPVNPRSENMYLMVLLERLTREGSTWNSGNATPWHLIPDSLKRTQGETGLSGSFTTP